MVAWALSTRSPIDSCKSPKRPIAKIVVQTIVIAQMNVAIAVNAGRRRDAIQSRSGQTAPIASSAVHGSFGKKTSNAHTRDTTASATIPSAISRRGGKLRTSEASAIARGATVMFPIASDENQ